MPALVLYPTPFDARLPTGLDLPALLRQAGFAGDAWGERTYLLGPRFSSLLMFLGCAPTIRAEAPLPGERAANFYYLELPPATEQPRFLGGEGTRPPRCPVCRASLPDWRDWLANGPEFRCRCPRCAAPSPLAALDWRTCAAFASAQIVVHGVFEGEAVPGETLLACLQRHSGLAWAYFYRLPGKT
jgi:hypothetical protein